MACCFASYCIPELKFRLDINTRKERKLCLLISPHAAKINVYCFYHVVDVCSDFPQLLRCMELLIFGFHVKKACANLCNSVNSEKIGYLFKKRSVMINLIKRCDDNNFLS